MLKLPRLLLTLSAATLLPFSVLVASAEEASPALPAVLLAGLEAYKTGGPEAAIKAWVKGGPFEGSKEAVAQSNMFQQMQAYVGAYTSYDVVQVHTLTKSTKIIYLIMNFESGPIYGRFVAYKPMDRDWVLPAFDFNGKVEVVFPQYLLHSAK